MLLTWYHIVIIYDSGNSTEAHKLRIYVNGTEKVPLAQLTTLVKMKIVI